MSNFFDKNLLQNVVGGLIVLVISVWLSRRTIQPDTSGKGWKIIIIISFIMILSGLYLLGKGSPNGGFDNPETSVGLSLLVLGVLLRYIGKFIGWWQR